MWQKNSNIFIINLEKTVRYKIKTLLKIHFYLVGQVLWDFSQPSNENFVY